MTIAPIRKDTEENSPTRHAATRNQAILSIDVETWQGIVDALNITEPMIEHRQEANNGGPGARSWYS